MESGTCGDVTGVCDPFLTLRVVLIVTDVIFKFAVVLVAIGKSKHTVAMPDTPTVLGACVRFEQAKASLINADGNSIVFTYRSIQKNWPRNPT
jgi:hypothetical protein